ncbi:Nitrogen permease regulator 3 [Malassezia cuniculi]|uniref:Nitrogen permease regulator 3 n=1 Tax=Malassezia cuniculi TaxID=948313 RepID=A0AAF0EQF2_9BASI|nr:Nitrogen permease regulator 3 [Malassezia cuniculi]
MSPLLAVLLVASSSRGANVVFHSPRKPRSAHKHHMRTKGTDGDDEDNPIPEIDDSSSESSLSDWDSDTGSSDRSFDRGASMFAREDEERRSRYDWSGSHMRGSDGVPSSRSQSQNRGSSRVRAMRSDSITSVKQEAMTLFGFDQGVLAGILSPKPEQCHKRFELGIDGLTFLSHPVCAGRDSRWDASNPTCESSVTQFSLVMVLERPDPQLLLPGLDLAQLTNTFYALVFKVTAVLYAEEIRAHYVSTHVKMLNTLRDECIQHDGTHRDYLRAAVAQSSLAEAIYRIQRSIGRCRDQVLTVNGHIDLHLQLPPLLIDPGKAGRLPEVQHVLDPIDPLIMRGDTPHPSAPELSTTEFQEWTNATGPFLVPWKTLLLPEDFSDPDGPNASLYVLTKPLADLCEPTLQGARTFSQAAEKLGWDLYSRVYPMARHLIYYGKARVIHVPRIQALHAIDPSLDLSSLTELSERWRLAFPMMRSLPQLMADISASLRPFVSLFSQRTNPKLVLRVLVWLLRHRVVIQMHVHLRLVATERDQEHAIEFYRRHHEKQHDPDVPDSASASDSDDALQRLIETLRQKQPLLRRNPSAQSHQRSASLSSDISSRDEVVGDASPLQISMGELYDDAGDFGELANAGAPCATFIPEPSRASRIENEWITAMLDGKHAWYTRWFLRFLPYLNGKHTLDEIVVRERIRRRDLRLVLAQFEHNIVRFVHP